MHGNERHRARNLKQFRILCVCGRFSVMYVVCLCVSVSVCEHWVKLDIMKNWMSTLCEITQNNFSPRQQMFGISNELWNMLCLFWLSSVVCFLCVCASIFSICLELNFHNSQYVSILVKCVQSSIWQCRACWTRSHTHRARNFKKSNFNWKF